MASLERGGLLPAHLRTQCQTAPSLSERPGGPQGQDPPSRERSKEGTGDCGTDTSGHWGISDLGWSSTPPPWLSE